MTEEAAKWAVESWALALGIIVTREKPLTRHFIWICDRSGGMAKYGRIQALNTAICEVIPLMQKEAEEYPFVRVLVRAIKFSNGAQWHIAQPTPVEDFKWVDLTPNGTGRDMGKALSMVAEQLKILAITKSMLPPVLVLISYREPTDDFKSGLRKLMEQPWGRKSVRVAIALGQNADCEVLQKFIGHPELKPLNGSEIEKVVQCYLFYGLPDFVFPIS